MPRVTGGNLGKVRVYEHIANGDRYNFYAQSHCLATDSVQVRECVEVVQGGSFRLDHRKLLPESFLYTHIFWLGKVIEKPGEAHAG